MSDIYLDPTTHIIDNSKLNDYKRCPRYFLFRHIFGWGTKFPSVDLIFGSAYHAGHEFLGNEGYSMDNLKGAMDAFLEIWREEFSPAMDDEWQVKKGKSPKAAEEAFKAYIKKYGDGLDPYVPLWNEVGIPVPLGKGRSLIVKIDRIAKRKRDGKIVLLDFKTSGRETSYWAESWENSSQFFGYIHGALCMYEFTEVVGLVIDGTFFYKSSPPKFRRHLLKKNPIQMQAWLENIHFWFSQIERDMDLLLHEETKSPVMKAFPKNDRNCVSYGRLCPFHAYCASTPNPLRYWRNPDDTPSEFKTEFWNPLEGQVSLRLDPETGKMEKVEKKERKKKEDNEPAPSGSGLLSTIIKS